MLKFHLRPEEKLSILQKEDAFRKWYSLDDGRICVLCDRFITGRQIRITRDQRGQHRLHCPTETCRSTPRDWMYAGNALLSDDHEPGLWDKLRKPLQKMRRGFHASSDK